MSVIDNNLSKPTVAIDFDGTLCDSNFPECGPMIEGARDALLLLRQLGFLILIYSCRTSHWHYDYFGNKGVPVMERPQVVKMRQFLVDNDIPFDEIDDGSRGKPYASFYIDDRGIRFTQWPDAINTIISTLHNQRKK